MYELALAGSGVHSNREEIREHYMKLTGKLLTENLSTHRLPNGTWSMTPAEELGRIRTVKIPVQSAPSGNATFGITFSAGKVEDVVYLNGSEELKPVADKVKAAKFDMPFPDDGIPVRLIRRGILTCHSGSCDFTLLLSDSAFVDQLPKPY